ncbi:MAG: hypothetical protein ABJA34_11255, partial [Pseudonocardiales bacterium]
PSCRPGSPHWGWAPACCSWPGRSSMATALGIHLLEALAIALPETPNGSVSRTAAETLESLLDSAQTVLIGPGPYDAEESQELVPRLVQQVGKNTTVASTPTRSLARNRATFPRARAGSARPRTQVRRRSCWGGPMMA